MRTVLPLLLIALLATPLNAQGVASPPSGATYQNQNEFGATIIYSSPFPSDWAAL